MLRKIQINWDKSNQILTEEHFDEVMTTKIPHYHACLFCAYSVYDDEKTDRQSERNKLLDKMSLSADENLADLLTISRSLKQGTTYNIQSNVDVKV